MTTLKINTDDMTSIKEIQTIIVQKFNFDVQVINESSKQPKKTKWEEFAEKMDGLFTPDIIEHIESSRKEARLKKANSSVEDKLKNLKIINPNRSKRLEEALDFLNEEFKKNGSQPLEKAREEYLTNKYNV